MFFKRKITVPEYCKTRLNLLFSDQQAQVWLQLKQTWPDLKYLSVSDHLFLTHIRAAHIVVLSMVVTKKYASNIDIFIEMESFVDNYLNSHNESYIRDLIPLYNRAMGSAAIDSILPMAKLIADNLYQDKCSQKTILTFRVQLYGAIDAIRADFKKVKLIPNRNISI